MPKYYCDYCDAFLTHDSPSVRKTHNGGRKHKENVRMFYQAWLEKQAQKIVDATTKAFTQQRMMGQQGHGQTLPGMALPGMTLPGMALPMMARGMPMPPMGMRFPGLPPGLPMMPPQMMSRPGMPPMMPPPMGIPSAGGVSVTTNTVPSIPIPTTTSATNVNVNGL